MGARFLFLFASFVQVSVAVGADHALRFDQGLGFSELFGEITSSLPAHISMEPPSYMMPVSALPPQGSGSTLPMTIRTGEESAVRSFARLFRDAADNEVSVMQHAAHTAATFQILGADNRVAFVQSGQGAQASLELSGDRNRVALTQAAPNTTIDLKIKAHAAAIEVNQTSPGARFVLAGEVGNEGWFSVIQ